MKKCRHCNCKVDTDKNFCPICFNRLDTVDDVSKSLYTPRKDDQTTLKRSLFLYKLFLFLTVVSVTACVLINFFSGGIHWFWLVVTGEAYIWVLIAHTILSNRSPFKKVVLQVITITLILVAANILTLGDWLVPYVLPSVSLGVLLSMALMLLISPTRGELVIGFSFIAVVLGVMSLVFLLAFKDTYDLLNIINLSCAAVSVFGYNLFGFNSVRKEFVKKWHL